MKCANCGAELQVGSVRCSVCGEEAQIVSDYNILEDELLQEMLNGRNSSSDLFQEMLNGQDSGSSLHRESMGRDVGGRAGKGDSSRQRGNFPQDKRSGETGQAGKKGNPSPSRDKKAKEGDKAGKKGSSSRGGKKPIGWAIAAVMLMAFLLVDIIFVLNHSRYNSYDYQIGQGEKLYSRKDYEGAEEFLLRAAELSDGEDGAKAELLLAQVYHLQGKTEKAIKTLQDVIKYDNNNQKAYQQLIQIYEQKEDYAAIYELWEGAEDERIRQLFEEYQVEPPEFIQEEGIHEEIIAIEISAQPGCTVLYTTDGSDPRQGLEYQGPIPLEPESTVRIRTVSRNEFGVYSEEAEGTFQVALPKPDMPRVSPMGGDFNTPQPITVYVPSGCNVYYTWDGSAPSEASNRYMGAIDMPEGNNILSLIVVDEYGRYSDVLKCNYIYFP